MTKQQLIEATQSMLQQHDKTGRFHDEVVAALITTATNTMLMNVVDLDLYAKQYKSVAVAQDSEGVGATDQYYSSYPDGATIVDTIDPHKGVRSIHTMKGSGLQFAPIRGAELQLFEGLDISAVSDVIGYRPETDRVTYMGTPTDSEGEVITSVRMNLVVSFMSYLPTDTYHIPGGSHLELFDMILQILRGVPPKDLLNNNADVTRQPEQR